jgi:hypothetical protein
VAGSASVLVHNSSCFDPAKAAAKLPAYGGGQTVGHGVGSNGLAYNVVSGNERADAELINIVNKKLQSLGILRGSSKSVRAHDAEQKFAAIMLRDGITKADIVINNPSGPCGVRLGCRDVLGALLGPNRQLTVHWKNQDGVWENALFGGK